MPGSINAIAQEPVEGRSITPAADSGGQLRLLPIVLIFYAALIPLEFRVELLGQAFYAPRIAGFLALPWLLGQAASQASRFRLLDGAFLCGVLWMIVSFMVVYDVADGLVRGGALAIDAALPYLAARFGIRSLTDLRRFLILIAPGMMAAAAFLPIESFSRTFIVKPLAESVFGARQISGIELPGAPASAGEVRLGLMRATGGFSHPIIGGLFLAGMLPLFITSRIKGWPKVAGVLACACAFFTVSSAAILAFFMALGLLAFDYIQRRTTLLNWPLFILAGLFFMVLIEVAAGSGVTGVIGRLTFNPQTAFYRTLIWDYGTASVLNHPFFGIGYEPYERASWMPPSVDNQWLLLAIRHGLPAALPIFLVTVVAIAMTARQSGRHAEGDRRFLVGLAITLTIFMTAGFTVAFFGAVVPLFYILLGAAVSIASLGPD